MRRAPRVVVKGDIKMGEDRHSGSRTPDPFEGALQTRLSRRQFLQRVAVASVGVTTAGGILAACGSMGGVAESNGSNDDTRPILVGSPIPVTGAWAADGQAMTNGMNLAIDYLNAQGGVLGRKLRLVVYDVEDVSPEKLNAAADKLLMQDKVSALITGYGLTGVDEFVYGKYPQPYIAFNGSSAQIANMADHPDWRRHIFMLGDGEKPYGEASFKFLSSLDHAFPKKSVVGLAADNNWDKLTVKACLNAAKAAGWDTPMHQVFPYGTREWGPILSKIRALEPGIISMSVLDPADAKTFIDQFRADPTPSLLDVQYCASINGFAKIVGKNGEGVTGYTCAAGIPGTEQGDLFYEEYRSAYKGDPALSITASCWDGTLMWAKAVEQVGDPDDYGAVGDAIHALGYVGAQGTYAFAEENYVPLRDDLGDHTLPMQYFQVHESKLNRISVGTKSVTPWFEPPWIRQS